MRAVLVALMLATLASGCVRAWGQGVDKKDYVIYARNEVRTFEAMVEVLGQADVVFLGEQHDHAMGHALQTEIFQALYARQPKLALSMEMFERDVQGVLDEYLSGFITENSFLQAARPWPNYKTDYRPMVEFCKEKGLPVVAANPPRRYVNIVSRKGQEALQQLPRTARAYLPALPYSMDIPSEYDRKLTEIFGGAHGDSGPDSAATGLPGVANMKQAQALWDETMKDSILRFRKAKRGWQVVHLNGAMHSDYGHGIVDRLRKAVPRLRICLVTIRPDADFPNINPLKYAGAADFVIVTRLLPKK
jgi:uncharacterized iron-regulated protein